MDRFQYLALMAGCLLITLPLEFWLAARVYRRPRRLLLAVVPVAGAFVAWDLFAIRRDHWTFSPEYTTGVLLPGGIPLEEVVFFLVIPICGLLTYEAVGTMLRGPGRDPTPRSGQARPDRGDRSHPGTEPVEFEDSPQRQGAQDA